jgi:predicted transcriptional regulator
MYLFNTPKELSNQLSKTIEKERLSQRLSQKELASKADIPLPTYKSFIYHQKLSLESLFKLLFALKMHDNIEGLLKEKTQQSLSDLKENDLPKRIRQSKERK